MRKFLYLLFPIFLFINCAKAEDKSEQNVTAEIEYLYQTILNRDADSEGLKYWSNVLENKEKSETEIALFFFNSQEFKNRALGDEEFLTTAYKVFLKREPTEDELKKYLSSSKPVNREEILKELIKSNNKQEQEEKKDLIPVIEIVKMQNTTPFWTNGKPAKLVILDGSKSNSKNSQIKQFIWREHNCEGNVIGVGKKISLYYMQNGNYKVALEIIDNNGTTACKIKDFKVEGIEETTKIPPQNIIIEKSFLKKFFY